MPDIGASLREARMRTRTDITEIEAQTKIRAKYLRALENEEWDLLPGPTYVKTFLRTYAEALGLDGRLLVEEYKLRHERLSDVELQPIAPRGTRQRERPPRRRFPRAGLVVLVLAGLVVALYLLGRGADNENSLTPAGSGTTPAGQTQTTRTQTTARTTAGAAPRRTTASLRLIPTGQVYVCLKAAGSRTLVNGRTLSQGQTTPTYHSRRFRILVGNNRLRLRVNGHDRTLPATPSAASYEITRSGRVHRITSGQPVCRP